MSSPEHCGELATELIRHARLLHLLRNRYAPAGPAGLDRAAFGVLMVLVKQGPRRQGELAEATFLDPSTVSRYVAHLARTGLVARRPDPTDGRAVQLVATPEGIALAEQAMAQRSALISELIAGWAPEDVTTLVHLLRRLNDGMETWRDPADPPVRPGGA
jgi:DNA-binding MarR family transcriptional regulator